MTGHQPPEDRLITDMIETNRDTSGDTISKEQYRKHGDYNPWQAVNRFGSWNEAKATAGVYSHKEKEKKITGKDILKDLKRINQETDSKVTVQDYKEKGRYSISTLYNRFSSLDTALRKAYNL